MKPIKKWQLVLILAALLVPAIPALAIETMAMLIALTTYCTWQEIKGNK